MDESCRDAELWSLPVALDRVQLRLARPFEASDRPGTTPETSLRGAVFAALVAVGCRLGGSCAANTAAQPCRQPDTCPVGWMYRPHCPYQRRDHASPLAMRVTPLAAAAWQLDVVLWGRHARAWRAQVVAALATAGERGLGDRRGKVAFACTWEPTLATTLGRHCRAPAPPEARLVFDSPCQSRAADLPGLVGNTAHDLVQWALMDAGRSAQLGKRGCDELAEAARAAAAASLANVACRWQAKQKRDLGLRTSRGNQRQFRLQGFTGAILLSGNLAPAWPWLMALALRGAGGRHGFGLGQVHLRAD